MKYMLLSSLLMLTACAEPEPPGPGGCQLSTPDKVVAPDKNTSFNYTVSKFQPTNPASRDYLWGKASAVVEQEDKEGNFTVRFVDAQSHQIILLINFEAVPDLWRQKVSVRYTYSDPEYTQYNLY